MCTVGYVSEYLCLFVGTLSDDMEEMMNHFIRGKTYLSTKDSDAVGRLEINIGTVITCLSLCSSQ